MKIRELVESRQQLNEFAPLAVFAPYLPAALGWLATASVGAIISWILGAWGGYEAVTLIRDIHRRDGLDPRQWSKQSVDSVLEMAVWTALGPAVANRIGRKVVASAVGMWPVDMKQKILDSIPELKVEPPSADPAPTRTTGQATRRQARLGIAGGEDGIFNPAP